jgi:hypothetical protein
VSHEQEDAGGSGDAGEGSGKETDEGADIDEEAKDWDTADLR